MGYYGLPTWPPPAVRGRVSFPREDLPRLFERGLDIPPLLDEPVPVLVRRRFEVEVGLFRLGAGAGMPRLRAHPLDLPCRRRRVRLAQDDVPLHLLLPDQDGATQLLPSLVVVPGQVGVAQAGLPVARQLPLPLPAPQQQARQHDGEDQGAAEDGGDDDQVPAAVVVVVRTRGGGGGGGVVVPSLSNEW
ncbi:hypothetical protein PG984_012328 [Apiospora sp. TS-2023a]